MRLVRVSFLAAALAAANASAAPPAPPLSPADRSAIRAAVDSGATDDAGLWAGLVALARTELGQRVRPRRIDARWTIEPPAVEVEDRLSSALRAGDLPRAMDDLSPADPQYRALRVLRIRYARYAAAGGWTPLPTGGVLREGARGVEVARLRVRLAAEDYRAAGSDEAAFDPALAQALRAFQADHALASDGTLGPATRSALNVPVAARLDQIDANLERRRWASRSPPGERIEVDTGGAVAVLYRNGAAVLEMRVIVGAPATPTPMFASNLESIVFNPPWTPPADIVAHEILPRARREPGYLERNGFSFMQGRLVQAPGPGNALGRIKFDFASPFGVYLHDTSAPQLFVRPDRALSHGCVRLQRPGELAALLLGENGQATVDEALAAGVTRRTRLPRAIPLFVQHWTVVVQVDGRPLFRPDVYGWDRKLAVALRAADAAL